MTEPTYEEVSQEPVPEPEPKPELVTLYMKRTRPETEGWEDPNENLHYGPYPAMSTDALEGNITFHNRYAVCRADHPLLDELLRKYPVEIVTTEDKERIWVDAETGKEYKSERSYKAAQRAKKNKRKA